ncbi:inorganic phosphate transporter [Pseudarthrobacter sp. J75]|uniref:inorganic phosphate transporter n=1 Tax=unclassified Pseudarthrobacter TaxID=2647000 RepID=UPI002E81A286|nr:MULTISPECIES: inorganic phosphate transporter [unclassified Pseudarthrobacter]MEE2521953.1 inorganic phosphate transporter [Pseudarthrobacter sp. J47]MEE2528878.1 inorganic phosphate transporter [Pseudarthrobacter sp. J75]
MVPVFFGVVVLFTAAFSFLNGFRDVSTAVALSVRTRALTPSIAVLLAAFFNLIGGLLSATLAVSVANSWVTLPDGINGLSIVISGLASAFAWGVLTWWLGIPSSSTHALVGGLAGAGLASVVVGGNTVGGVDQSLLFQVVLPLAISPLIAFAGAYLSVVPIAWATRFAQPSIINRRFRRAQSVAAGAVAFGHGLQDGQRVSAVLLLAMISAGIYDGGIPLWVILLTAVTITAGTLFGGWRISHTLGHKLTRIDPLRGFVAQTLGAVVLFIGAIGLHWPVSTTHSVTAAVLGAGETQRFASTNRRLVLQILGYWLLTPVVTAALAFVIELAMSPLGK